MASDEYDKLKDQFQQLFGKGGKLHIIRAPGRVNLIGEHTDYNDGFVFPMAIEPQVSIVCRSRTDNVVKISSTVFPNEFVEFSIQKKIERSKPAWGNYVRGVAAGLIAAGIPLAGMDALVCNSLPVGSGLSSSAAVEVATARSLLRLIDSEMESQRVALICQKAEHDYAMVPSGIMDQMIVASAKAGHAMLLDCRGLSQNFIPIDSMDLRVVIVNSMVRHEHSGGEYAMRRRQCEEGVAALKRAHLAIIALRDVTLQQVEAARAQMSELVYRRCRHVVSENNRTTLMAAHLSEKHYDEAGELMVQSHQSLRDDYEVSCPELDLLVDESMKVKGIYGARMTGGGFGGCIVALAIPRAVPNLTKHLHSTYTAKFGRQPHVFATTATGGANVIE